MVDRISSDNPSVQTIRATLTETATGTRVELPADAADDLLTDPETAVRIVLDGHEHFARIGKDVMGETRHVSGVYDSPEHARNPRDGVDRLPEWVDEHGVRVNGSVLIDVIEPEFLYGFRAPGETAVYDAREPPKSSLQDIAKGLEER